MTSCGGGPKQAEVNESNTIDQTSQIVEPRSPSEPGSLEHFSGCAFTMILSGETLVLNTPDKRELNQINKILRYSGIPVNFRIFKADMDNAFATIINNERYIVYGKGLLKSLDEASDTYWSSMSVLAHEIGHHLSGHTLMYGNNPALELEADKFTGFVLYKLGASLPQSLVCMNLIGSETGSESHPDKYQRMKAIQDGWEEAAALRYDGGLPPPPDDIPESAGNIEFTKEQMWSKEDIDLYFSADSVGLGPEYNETYATGIITEVYKEDFSIVAVDIYATIEEQGTYTKQYKIYSENLCNVCLSWFVEALVPGRKIGFRYIAEGSGDFRTITYLKPLPAD